MEPRHNAVVNITDALRFAGPFLDLWRLSSQHPGVPLWSGGLMDSWPAVAVDALGVLKAEWEAIKELMEVERG